MSVHCATVANMNCSEEEKILKALILTQCNNRNLGQSLVPVVALEFNESLEDFSFLPSS